MNLTCARYVAISLVILALSACASQPPASVVSHASKVKVQAPKNPYSITVKKGDTLVLLSEKYRIRKSELISLNHLKKPYILTKGMVLKLPDPQYHIVQKGDTLYSIARSYLVDVPTLVQVNHLQNPEHILVGSKLYFSMATAESSSASSLPVQENSPSEESPLPVAGAPGTSSGTGKGVTVDELQPLPAPTSSTKPASGTLSRSEPASSPSTTSVLSTSNEPPSTAQATEPLNKPSEVSKARSSGFTPTSASVSTAPLTPVAHTGGFSWPIEGKIISRFGPRKGGLYNDGINIAAPEGTAIKAASDGVVVYSGNELRGYGNLLLIKHDAGFVTAYAHTAKNLVQKDAVIRKGDTIAYVGKTGHVSSPQLHFSIRKDRKALNPEKHLPLLVSNR